MYATVVAALVCHEIAKLYRIVVVCAVALHRAPSRITSRACIY